MSVIYLPPEVREIIKQRISQQNQGEMSENLLSCFDWELTETYGEGYDFWKRVSDSNFEDFFRKYPKVPPGQDLFFWQDGKQHKIARVIAPPITEPEPDIRNLTEFKSFIDSGLAVRNYFVTEMVYEDWWKDIPVHKKMILRDLISKYDIFLGVMMKLRKQSTEDRS